MSNLSLTDTGHWLQICNYIYNRFFSENPFIAYIWNTNISDYLVRVKRYQNPNTQNKISTHMQSSIEVQLLPKCSVQELNKYQKIHRTKQIHLPDLECGIPYHMLGSPSWEWPSFHTTDCYCVLMLGNI